METGTDSTEVPPRKETQRPGRGEAPQPRTPGGRHRRRSTTRLENPSRSYKGPSWKRRAVPRSLGERTQGDGENTKRWKNISSRIGMVRKQNHSICSLRGGGAWFHQSLGHRHWSDPLSDCRKQRGQAQRYPLPKHSLQHWQTLGAWHCRSSEKDENPTCPAESKAR